MPEDAESQPVKRGPGRPRKVAAPKVDVSPPDEWKTSEPEPVAKSADPRIGQSCPSSWSSVGYGDGSTYRCENGKIVERVI
jgi:hypothetical protein